MNGLKFAQSIQLHRQGLLSHLFLSLLLLTHQMITGLLKQHLQVMCQPSTCEVLVSQM